MNKQMYFDNYTQGLKHLSPLNPTGRWKLRFDEYGDLICMYIEHRYFFFFTDWISEWRIRDKPDPLHREVIFECEK